jgi:hypothetical protein
MGWLMCVKQTFTGRFINVSNPTDSSISIVDIAHALSLSCRFSGHVSKFSSVADHSVRVVNMMMRWGITDRWELLAGLLHDASEAYLSDISTPVKKMPEMKGYLEVEDSLMRNIFRRFGVDIWPLPSSVKEADWVVLWREAHTLMRPQFQHKAWEPSWTRMVRGTMIDHLDVLEQYGTFERVPTSFEAATAFIDVFVELHPAAARLIEEGS